MKNPYDIIVSFEDYVEIIGIPTEQQNKSEVKNRIERWLVQATDQFDSMISSYGNLGTLYTFYESLTDTKEDNFKKYKLKKAICSWVETFVISGKFWVNGLPTINSNINIDINSSSEDGFIEGVRKDIIQDLVALGLYKTTNFSEGNVLENKKLEDEVNNLVILTKQDLDENYLKIVPQKPLGGPLDIANNDFTNGGNITGSYAKAKNRISNYELEGVDIDFNKNNVSNVRVENSDKSYKTDNILDPLDGIYKKINEFSVEYFGGFTREQVISIANRVFQQSGLEWQTGISYYRGQTTFKLIQVNSRRPQGILQYYYSLRDNNLNNDPETEIDWWLEVKDKQVPIEDILEQLKPFIIEEIKKEVPIEVAKQLEELPTKEFISEATGETIEFETEEDFTNYKNVFGIDDSYFEDVPETPIDLSAYAKKDESNTFTQRNIFNKGLNSKEVINIETPSSAEYAIRFQNDNFTGTSYDMLRVHKAGRKWGIKANFSNGNFQNVSVDGATLFNNNLVANSQNGLILRNGTMAYIQFQDGDGIRKAYVGFDSGLSTNLFKRFAFNISDTSGWFEFNRVIRGITPVSDNDLTTKAYVDNAVATGGSTTGLAKLNENNTFTRTNTFNSTVIVPNPTQNNHATNKQYVDNLNTTLTNKVNTNTQNITNLTSQVQANTQNITTNTANILSNTQEIENINNKLTSGSIVLLKGNYSATTTYKLGEAVIYNDKLCISLQDNNRGNTPNETSQFWYVDKTAQVSLENVAKLNENNTYTGANTFNGAIIVPTPTLATHAANKEYIDNKVYFYNPNLQLVELTNGEQRDTNDFRSVSIGSLTSNNKIINVSVSFRKGRTEETINLLKRVIPSSTEQETGEIYFGKSVYIKTFEFSNVSAQVNTIVSSGVDKVVSSYGMATGYYGSSEFQQLPFSGSNDDEVAIRLTTTGQLYLFKRWVSTLSKVYGWVKYTKK